MSDRGEHVGLVVPDVGPAVAILVDREAAEARGHELALAHRAGPRAGERRRRHPLLVEDMQRLHQLAAEVAAAAAVIGKRGQRVDDGEVAHDAAIVGFDRPQRDDEARRHAIAPAHLVGGTAAGRAVPRQLVGAARFDDADIQHWGDEALGGPDIGQLLFGVGDERALHPAD